MSLVEMSIVLCPYLGEGGEGGGGGGGEGGSFSYLKLHCIVITCSV